jgi:replication factor A1
MRLLIQFRKIEEVESLPATTSVDIIGVVESVDDPSTITRKDGSEAQKRSITLRDDSNKSIELTFWGDYSTNPGDQLDGVRPPLRLTPLHLPA